MKKLAKLIVFILFLPFVLSSCGCTNNTSTITFVGTHVVFSSSTVTINKGEEYTTSISAEEGYTLSYRNIVVTSGNKRANNGWSFLDNKITIGSTLTKNDVKIIATAYEIIKPYLLNVNSEQGITITDKPNQCFANVDITLSGEYSVASIKPIITINHNLFDQYNLSLDNNRFSLLIKGEYITGKVDINLKAVSDNIITLSTPHLKLITYGVDAVQCFLPSSVTGDVAISCDKDNLINTELTGNIININSIGNFIGTVNITISHASLVNAILVIDINYPMNMQEALDAFIFASINIGFNQEFDITFNFDNAYDVYDFYYSLEIYGRYTDMEVNYNIGKNQTNSFLLKPTSFATQSSSMQEGDKYYLYNFANLNYLNHINNVDVINQDFYIDKIIRKLKVNNSEELFWAVEHGYQPIISDTTVENIYNTARAWCSEINITNLSDFEAFRLIFEYLNQKTHYDYWAIEQDDNIWPDLKAYFLEGVFLDNGKAVCDGFSKAYALMCGIFGLPCFRSYGFTSDSGHAWNYIKLEGAWYLTCPTWCKLGMDNVEGKNICFMYYEAFANGSNFFYEEDEINFSDLAFPNTPRSEKPYLDLPITSLDVTSDNHTFHITSDDDARAVYQVVKDNIKESYSAIAFSYNKGVSSSTLDTWISLMAHNHTANTTIFEVYYATKPSAYYNYGWLFYIAK